MLGKGQSLSDDHEVMRYFPSSKLKKDEHGNILGFLPQAFQDPDAVSVNWLEFFSGDRQQRIEASVRIFRSTLKVRSSSAFGTARVAVIKHVGKVYEATLRVVYAPEGSNLSHSEIRHIPTENYELLAALADEAFSCLIKNADIID